MTQNQKMLDLYIQAEIDVLKGKSVSLRGEQMTLEDLDKIRAGRQEWEQKVNLESSGGKSYSLATWS